MQISFVSTLSLHDEEKLALQLLKAVKVLLEDAGFDYVLKIETSSGECYSQSKSPIFRLRTELSA